MLGVTAGMGRLAGAWRGESRETPGRALEDGGARACAGRNLLAVSIPVSPDRGGAVPGKTVRGWCYLAAAARSGRLIAH